MKKNIIRAAVSIITASSILLMGCGSGSGSAAPATSAAAAAETTAAAASSGDARKIQLGHVNPGKEEDNLQHMSLTFADKLNELSGGKIQVDIVADSQLGSEREMLEGMEMGTVDMALTTNSAVGALDKEFQVFDFPYIFGNREQAYAVFDDPEIMDPMAQKLYDEYAIKLLVVGDNGFRNMMNNVRPVNTVEDVKGMKIRLMENAIQSDCFKAFGASPTTMAFSEVYTACQQGTVDGFELPIASTYSGSYWEVIKYYSLTEHLFTPLNMMMSAQTWESFTEEEQGWIQAAADAAKEENRRYIQEKEQGWLEEMGTHMEVNTVEDKSTFIEAAQSIYPTYAGDVGEEIVKKVQDKVASLQ